MGKANKYKPEIIYYPFIGEKMGDEPFKTEDNECSWAQQLKKLANRKGVEIHTPDKAEFKNVKGVLFFDNMFYHNLKNLQFLFEKKLLHRTIYIDYEPPTGHAKKHEPKSIMAISKMFKSVVTYDDDLAGTGNFVKGNVANFYADRAKRVAFSRKKFVCMVANNTTNEVIVDVLNSWNHTNYYNGHNVKYHEKAIYHKRKEIAEYFLLNNPSKMDLYGACWPEEFSVINRGTVDRKSKVHKMAKYKFAFTFDSYVKQRGYISEKIFDAFFARVVPIYLGADNVTDYIPKECFIDMRDFESYDDLYRYLMDMKEEEYNDRLRSIEEFLSSSKFNEFFSSTAIAKTLWSAINSPVRHNYDNSEAKKVLDQLKTEKEKVRQREPGVIRVEKERRNGKWCFVATVSCGELSGPKATCDVYKKYGNMFNKIKVRCCTSPRGDGGELKFDIPYEDIMHHRKERYYMLIAEKLYKLQFFATDVINDTDIDARYRLDARKNILSIKRQWTVIRGSR